MTINDTAADRVTHSVIMVDGPMARRWLERNTNNRPILPSIVSRYRRDMAEGRWTFAGDPIRFAADGRLLDGQHRLSAVADIDHGFVLPMLVVRGLADESQGVMDQGRKRTGADQLGLRGYRHAAFLASSTRQYLSWTNGFLFRDNKVATAEITTPWMEQWVTEHPEEVEFLLDMHPLIRSTDALPSAAGAAAIGFRYISQEDAREFFALLAGGAGTEGHPIVTLDRRLARIRRERLQVPTRDHLAFFILSWNAWRENRQMLKFQRPPGGSWSISNFPEPR